MRSDVMNLCCWSEIFVSVSARFGAAAHQCWNSVIEQWCRLCCNYCILTGTYVFELIGFCIMCKNLHRWKTLVGVSWLVFCRFWVAMCGLADALPDHNCEAIVLIFLISIIILFACFSGLLVGYHSHDFWWFSYFFWPNKPLWIWDDHDLGVSREARV